MPTKTVIISDVHLSNGPTDYSWFKNDSTLKGFLQNTAKRTDVKELVLLGDIFDLWLYPVNVKPWTTQQIIQQWDNGTNSVVSALRECADKLPDVFYINGNHDMGVTKTDLTLISPKIKFISSAQYNATHAPGLHLEHGHLVDMFNAPDISGDAIQGLPFGYFITRLVATAKNHDDLWKELFYRVESHITGITFGSSFLRQKRSLELDIKSFDDWIEAGIENLADDAGETLIKIIVDMLMKYVRLYHPQINDSSTVILPDGSTVSIGEVKKHYHKLLPKWYRKAGSLSNLYRSALASTNLDWRAKQVLQSDPAKLVVMGHTHEGKSSFPAGGQYVNSGCWISGKQATYVEIEPAASTKAVVKAYPGNTPLAPSIVWAGPAIMAAAPAQPITASSLPIADEAAEAAWEEEPLPQFWQKGADRDE